MKIKKNLSGEALIKTCYREFYKVEDHRSASKISMADALMSGLAIFKLKMPSLLQFDKYCKEAVNLENLKTIFGIRNTASDTQVRDILDPVPHYSLFPVFKKIFSILQNEKVIDKYKYDIPGVGGIYVKPLDGTGYFSSTKIKCDLCLVKKSKDKDEEDELLYHHQMLGSGIVHPDLKTVIPFAPEPIMQQDGQAKNDCERNAAKRFYYRLKDEHPGLPFVSVGDAIFATVPNFKLIRAMNWHAIYGVKKGSHKSLFEDFESRQDFTCIEEIEKLGEKVIKTRKRIYRFKNNLFLTLDSDVQVNVLDYQEIVEWDGKRGPERQKKHFTWATDILITKENAYQLMRAGRARWKEENEVFNTLKNQGYNLEHNYGHGKQYLSANFAILMSLAFLIDQIEETCCELFKKAREIARTKYALWEKIKTLYEIFSIKNWSEMLFLIVKKVRISADSVLDTS